MLIKNMVRNSFFSLLSQVLIIAAGFFSQRVLFLQAGRELVGMNSVISNILAILSVSELGISTAVVFHLYQALAGKNEAEIAALMNLYRRAYIIFAAVITALGLCVMPHVHLFLKNNSFSLRYVRLIYGMWLLRTVLSYLLSYRRSILIADQKEYVVSIMTTAASVSNYLLIIVIVGLTSDYVLALGMNIVVEAAGNAALSYYVGRRYPFLKKLRNEPLPRTVVLQIFSDVKNIFIMRLSSKLLTCTDSLIISGFINVGTVGVYANYSLITQSVTNLILALSNAVSPSIGALFVEQDREKNYRALRLLTFAFFFVAVTAALGLLALMQPFIGDLWLDRGSLLGFPIVVCCALNCFVQTLGLPLTAAMNVSGLFERERNISLISAMVNLAVSLALVRTYGIAGVLVGTGCSYFVQMILHLTVFFRDFLKCSFLGYLTELVQYTLLAGAEMWAVVKVTGIVYGSGGFLRFLAVGILCVFVSAGVNLAVFCRSERMAELFGMMRGLWKRG